MDFVTGVITAQNTFSDPLLIRGGQFNFSLWGTVVATVAVQRSFDQGVTWLHTYPDI